MTSRTGIFLVFLAGFLSLVCGLAPFKSFSTLFPTKSATSPKSEQVAQLKQQLVQLTKGTSNGVKATLPVQESVAKIVQEISKFNQIQLSVKSNSAMNGAWKLLYTTNREFSAGKVGPFVGSVVQTIDLKTVNYINDLKLGSGIFHAELLGTFQNMPKNTWKVIFKNVKVSLAGVKVLEKALPGEGLWQVQYIDEDLRIFYANNIKTPEKRNLYIMQRV